MQSLSSLSLCITGLLTLSGIACSCVAKPVTPGATEATTPNPAQPVFQRAAISPTNEVRGTWVTTTANEAISNAANTAVSMKRLKDIGLNTVYVEVWKNGYTQFPSQTLQSIIGVDRRPNLMPQDPSDTPERLKAPARDLLEETLIEAHRNGLIYNAWFEYGFMAAHKTTDNHLRRMKKEWLSLDKDGGEVAPNGFVWMNPLHPETRKFLLDIVCEAVDKYDLDGVQLDDRIVWPYVTMGYDAYTKKIYAQEHDGKEPPLDHTNAAWMRWRADKVNEYGKIFVQEVRKRRPGLLISLSPAVYPWCYEYYLLEWPKWASWQTAILGNTARGPAPATAWDEFIPQNYRFNFKAFEQTWLDQIKHINELGGGRVRDMLAGIRVVGDGPDSTWADLKDSMNLVRSTGGGGSVHWFSRGVLDVFPKELTDYYGKSGEASNPHFPANWRMRSTVAMKMKPDATAKPPIGENMYEAQVSRSIPATYRMIVKRKGVWSFTDFTHIVAPLPPGQFQTTDLARFTAPAPADAEAVEFLIDRRPDMALRK